MTGPALAVEQPDGSRLYVHPVTDERAPSVTTIMKEGIGKPFLTKAATGLSGKYAAENWEELSRMPSWERVELIRYASDREWGKARDLGTKVHAMIENWIKGEPCEPAKETNPYMNSYISFMMDRQPEFSHSEVTVWSRKHGYAGTADAICIMKDRTFIIDFKSGRNLHSDVALQLSALAMADFILTDEGEELKIPQVDALAAVHIRPRSWHIAEIDHVEESWAAFLACRQLYSWIHDCSESVLRKVA